MSLGRVVVIVAVVVVGYVVISEPLETAQTTRDGVAQLGVAGDRAAQFVMALFAGDGGDTGVVPVGGVATGDGSSVRR